MGHLNIAREYSRINARRTNVVFSGSGVTRSDKLLRVLNHFCTRIILSVANCHRRMGFRILLLLSHHALSFTVRWVSVNGVNRS